MTRNESSPFRVYPPLVLVSKSTLTTRKFNQIKLPKHRLSLRKARSFICPDKSKICFIAKKTQLDCKVAHYAFIMIRTYPHLWLFWSILFCFLLYFENSMLERKIM